MGLIENGSWAPSAARTMKELLGQMKEITVLEPVITIRGAVKPGDVEQLEQLAQALMQ